MNFVKLISNFICISKIYYYFLNSKYVKLSCKNAQYAPRMLQIVAWQEHHSVSAMPAKFHRESAMGPNCDGVPNSPKLQGKIKRKT